MKSENEGFAIGFQISTLCLCLTIKTWWKRILCLNTLRYKITRSGQVLFNIFDFNYPVEVPLGKTVSIFHLNKSTLEQTRRQTQIHGQACHYFWGAASLPLRHPYFLSAAVSCFCVCVFYSMPSNTKQCIFIYLNNFTNNSKQHRNKI